VCAVIAAMSMLVGLSRWPTIHWELARAYEAATPDARLAIDAAFSGLNAYLGTLIGEFLGEVSLNAFFMLSGVALVRAARSVVGYCGVVAGAMGLVAALRNLTPAVSLIAEVNNYVLPLWLIVLGVVLVRWRSTGQGVRD